MSRTEPLGEPAPRAATPADTARHEPAPDARRVAFLTSELGAGGAEAVIVHLAAGLKTQGVEAAVCCLQGKGVRAAELESRGVPVHALQSARGHDLGALLGLRRFLNTFSSSQSPPCPGSSRRLDPASKKQVERVAFVTPKLVMGGAERVICYLMEALADRGIRTLCVCLECPGALGEEMTRRGLAVVSLDSTRSYDLMAVWRLAGILREFAPDVINIHDRASLPYVVLAGFLGVVSPIVFSAHGFLFRDFHQRRLKFRLPARWLSAMTAESKGIGARYARHLGWSKPIDIIPNGIPPIQTPPACDRRTRAQWGISEETFVFLTVGNARPEKGFEDLLAAARILRGQQTLPCFASLVSGSVSDKEYYADLLSQQEKGGLDKVVRFLGFQPDLEALYGAADAFVLPSRSEGLPLVILEAMMHGLPIIATRLGAIPEVLQDTALVVDAGAPNLLAEAMSRLLEDPALGKALGAKARERALQEYTVDRMLARYLETFQRVALSARETG